MLQDKPNLILTDQWKNFRLKKLSTDLNQLLSHHLLNTTHVITVKDMYFSFKVVQFSNMIILNLN